MPMNRPAAAEQAINIIPLPSSPFPADHCTKVTMYQAYKGKDICTNATFQVSHLFPGDGQRFICHIRYQSRRYHYLISHLHHAPGSLQIHAMRARASQEEQSAIRLYAPQARPRCTGAHVRASRHVRRAKRPGAPIDISLFILLYGRQFTTTKLSDERLPILKIYAQRMPPRRVQSASSLFRSHFHSITDHLRYIRHCRQKITMYAQVSPSRPSAFIFISSTSRTKMHCSKA